MNKVHFKDQVYTELARVTRALANPHRLEILDLLAQGEFTVENIATHSRLTVANASQHIQVLKAAQLVAFRRDGNSLFYRLSDASVFKAWRSLRELGIERISALERIIREFRNSTAAFETVNLDELMAKIDAGNVTVLDVRPEAEYKQGHIATARSIPLDDLAKRLKELPRQREIVAYCRGPFCVYADEAIAMLTRAGYKARRLKEGFPDWKMLGLPVEVTLN